MVCYVQWGFLSNDCKVLAYIDVAVWQDLLKLPHVFTQVAGTDA